jgi:branched-chain amino acid transport system substrate-binding protein
MLQRRLVKTAILSAGCLGLLGTSSSHAQISDDVVRIGVLVDMSGPYSQGSGTGSVRAAEMAVRDFGGKVLGKPIEVVYADHQNKPDVGATKARDWFDNERVDMVLDLVNSSVAAAVYAVATQKQRIAIVTGSGSTSLTNKDCSPYGIQYAYDTYALSSGAVRALAPDAGRNWFFISVDYTFGASLEADARETLAALGGRVVGSVKHPLSAPDFSSYILAASSAKADVVAFADGAGDFVNAMRAAREFGLGASGKPVVTGLFVLLQDLKALGLAQAQGLRYVDAFYWDLDDRTRAWSKRFLELTKAMPSFNQAADYSAVTQYLKAIEAAGTDNADAVMKKLRETRFDDFFLRNGSLRADGRMVHDMYLWEAKAPSESKGEWDLAKLKKVVPGDEAARPLDRSTCPLLRKP